MKEDRDIIHDLIEYGHSRLYKVLVERYQAAVFTLCHRIIKNREESEEVAQDVFVKCYNDLNQLKDRSKFRQWLLKIAFTRSIDRTRLKKYPTTDLFNAGEKYLAETKTPFTEMDKSDRRQLIKACIGRLEENQGAVITLFYLEDLSVLDIAGITGMSTSNVKVTLHRARNNLRAFIPNELKNDIIK